MRVNIVHPGAGELKYEIRAVIEFAHNIRDTGLEMHWENIGDPVAKGEEVPEWIRDIVSKAAGESMSYAYSPTKGLDDARDYLAKTRSKENGAELSPNNISFFNGLGDAITKTYTWLNPVARVLGPSPAYPTHSSVEGASGRSEHLTYNLDPEKGWLPDMEDIRNKVKYNPNIAGLLLINPDNPTGTVYPKEVLQEFVDIAKEYDLFLIADEIYANLAFEPKDFTSLAALADDVPTIIMRGLSKEVPWPGSRCGWLEFYNVEKDPNFAEYIHSIEEAKMVEVCSTTLPQMVLPTILSDDRYESYLRKRSKMYQERGKKAAEFLNKVGGFNVVEPQGAFYLCVTFEDGFLDANKSLPAANEEAQKLLDEALADPENQAPDKQFCYQLLAHTGVCTVPMLSGFNSHVSGLRMTLLEDDSAKFEKILKLLADAAEKYNNSTK
ncbi:MAG: pyridoxal phosphate-dependent aminotransferase [Micrococcaceae bacterium]